MNAASCTISRYSCPMMAKEERAYVTSLGRILEETHPCISCSASSGQVRRGVDLRMAVLQKGGMVEDQDRLVVVSQAQVVRKIVCPRNLDAAKELEIPRGEDFGEPYVTIVPLFGFQLVGHECA